jgi:hypothetical protein
MIQVNCKSSSLKPLHSLKVGGIKLSSAVPLLQQQMVTRLFTFKRRTSRDMDPLLDVKRDTGCLCACLDWLKLLADHCAIEWVTQPVPTALTVVVQVPAEP